MTKLVNISSKILNKKYLSVTDTERGYGTIKSTASVVINFHPYHQGGLYFRLRPPIFLQQKNQVIKGIHRPPDDSVLTQGEKRKEEYQISQRKIHLTHGAPKEGTNTGRGHGFFRILKGGQETTFKTQIRTSCIQEATWCLSDQRTDLRRNHVP